MHIIHIAITYTDNSEMIITLEAPQTVHTHIYLFIYLPVYTHIPVNPHLNELIIGMHAYNTYSHHLYGQLRDDHHVGGPQNGTYSYIYIYIYIYIYMYIYIYACSCICLAIDQDIYM